MTEYCEISVPGLPEGFSGMRIAQISDLHGAVFGKDNAELLAAVENSAPDCIFLTGDLADSPKQKPVIAALIPRLTAIAPVFFVSGNHDWTCGWTEELFSLLEDSGVCVLRNEWVTLHRNGDSIVLAGAEDPNGPADMISPEELVSSVRESTGAPPTLMLNHRNDRLSLYADLGVPVVFSGHAHGGVIRLPGIGGLFGHGGTVFPENEDGLCRMGGTVMAVSRGLGNIRGTFRFFNPPQLFCIELSAK